MRLRARDDDGIGYVRAAVPEFEERFQRELLEEGDEVGPFQAMSVFGGWVLERLAEGSQSDEVVLRAFQAIEHLIDDHRLRLGSDLATEFVERVAGHPEARERMGPEARRRAAAYD